MNYQQILQDIYEEIKPHADEGKQADYIPALAQVNPDQFGIFLQLLSGETYTLGASIAYLLKHHGNLHNRVEDVLHLYCMMCSVEMSCQDLAHAFAAFARSNEPFSYGGVTLSVSRVKRINAIMQTCGFYDEAGEFSFLVGLPGKSGVGGGIVAIYP